MNKGEEINEGVYARRRRELAREIAGGVAIIPNAPHVPYSYDLQFPPKANNDFLYLTGFAEPDSVLVIEGQGRTAKSILYLSERDPQREQWEGERLGIKRAKKRFKIDEIRPLPHFATALPAHLKGAHLVFFPPGVHGEYDRLIWEQLRGTHNPRLNFPYGIQDLRMLTAELRMVKDSHEIQLLKQAAEITAQGFLDTLPNIGQYSCEIDLARGIEAAFAKRGGTGLAFPTIVAAGKHSVTLHHTPTSQKLHRGNLVLIDAGAAYRGYCGDVTRTIPIAGTFTPAQAIVYDIVCNASEAVIRKVRPGVKLDELHRLAVTEISRGLVEAKLLKGPASAVVLSGKYKRYFMHGLGHWVGLDVHDVATVTSSRGGDFENSKLRPVKSGQVFTVEPGLYIPADDTTVPAEFRGIGIRIEDDILVTSHGGVVLTANLPKKRDEIVKLLARS